MKILGYVILAGLGYCGYKFASVQREEEVAQRVTLYREWTKDEVETVTKGKAE